MGDMSRVVAALVVVLVAAGLSGCGAGNVVDPVAAAATKSEQAGGIHVSTNVTLRFPSGGEGVITGEGAFNQDQGELTVDMSNLLQNTQLPLGSGGGVKARYLKEAGDPILYLYLPFLASQLPAGKTWIRLDLQRAAGPLGLNFNELLGQAGQNPAQVLDLLRASGEVTKVGPDIVGGVRVTEYRGTVDLRKALALKGVSRAAIQRLLDAGAPAELPVDVWIGDEDGLVHRVRTTSSTTIGAQTVDTATTTTMSDWGTTVFVDPPPHDQVFDAANTATAANTA
jgi:hypothetical protein